MSNRIVELLEDSSGGLATSTGIIIALHPIGSVVLRMDAINPATIYGGTWALITGDASLSFGDGTVRDGVASGENDPVNTLMEHSHTFTGVALGNHSHSTTTNSSGYTQADTGTYNVNRYAGGTSVTSSSVSAGTPTGTNANAGTAGATLDVRGSRISINVWSRTA